MDRAEFDKVNSVHFIGIGGIGMSALAQHFYGLGREISGSDLGELDERMNKLKMQGIKVYGGRHSVDYLSPSTDLVIASLAIPESNVELKEAADRGIKILRYPEALGMITRWYTTVAVAGTHGKTTTTAMIAKVAIEAGLDPIVILGSTADFLPGQNYRYGEGGLLIVEACEYHAGFLNMEPDITVITNIEHDHFDAYPTERDYYLAFQKLVLKTNEQHPVVLNLDYPLAQKLFEEFKDEVKFLTYGLNKDADLRVQDLGFSLDLPGEHNRVNALAASAVADLLKVDPVMVANSLSSYRGSGRRFEFKGKYGLADVYSDYGHHPTEIKATLAAFREKYPDAKLAVLYQAHQHSRTGHLLKDFADAFKAADAVKFAPIYAARDKAEDKADFPTSRLAEIVGAGQNNVTFFDDWSDLDNQFETLTKQYDVVVVMSAGDIDGRLF